MSGFKIESAIIGVALALSLPCAHAELILSGSPSAQNIEERNKNYTQLASELSKALGEPVRYAPPINEMGYGQEMRKGAYDILLDGPHFGSWRISKGLHKPVAESNVRLSFVIISPASDASIKSTEDLISKPVCTLPSPHLSTLMFLNQFPNPLQMPQLIQIDSYEEVLTKLQEGKCRAAVLNADWYEKSLTKDEQASLRVISNTPPLSGHILTVSNKVKPEQLEALSKRITRADPSTDTLVQALTRAGVRGGDPLKVRWMMAKPEDFKGLDELLVKQSFGWN